MVKDFEFGAHARIDAGELLMIWEARRYWNLKSICRRSIHLSRYGTWVSLMKS